MQRDEMCWTNKQQDGHAAAYQVPVCWNLDFNWTPWYCTRIHSCVLSLTTCTKLDLRQTFQSVTTSLSQGPSV